MAHDDQSWVAVKDARDRLWHIALEYVPAHDEEEEEADDDDGKDDPSDPVIPPAVAVVVSTILIATSSHGVLGCSR